MQTGTLPGVQYPDPATVNPAEGITLNMFTGYIVLGTPDISTQQSYGRSNYMPMGGYSCRVGGLNCSQALIDQYKGIFEYNVQTPVTVISDGTSNTIAFLETAGGYVDGGTSGKGWVTPTFGMNMTYSAFGTCPDHTPPPNNNPNCDFSANGKGFSWGTPSSMHAGNRINVLFADGSVRNIASGLDFSTYVALCGRADGQIVKLD
jgi:prepilin-type processing-associated H-X9-DG protein